MRHAQLSTNLEVLVELAIEVIEYLKTMGCNQGLHMISQALGIEGIEWTEVIEEAKVIEGAENIVVAEHIEWAENIEGVEDLEGTEEV
ncbi:hypothetical protein AAHA92_06115 [Salvia divinorum]|uniref:Uncharacterized protein n=1 Tax=Salvia divinorum TaxID=28513 RepID=A0ABD1I879_SALDI